MPNAEQDVLRRINPASAAIGRLSF